MKKSMGITMNKIIQEDLIYISSCNIPWEKLRDKTIFISGAGGFLASCIVWTLIHLNKTYKLNIKIIVNARDYEKAVCKFGKDDCIEYFPHDINCKFDSFVPIDYIIHAASYGSPKYFRDNPVETILPNVVGTNNLLDLARKREVKSFLFISSSGVCGHLNSYPAYETDSGILDHIDPASCYLESKRMGETLCMAYYNQYQIPIKIIRPSIVYGPGIDLNDGRSFADFISAIVNKKDIELTSDGLAERSFLYISDAISGIFRVLLWEDSGTVFNLAPDKEISIVNLARMLAYDVFKKLGLKVIFKDDVKQFLRVEFSKTAMDNSKLKSIGWEPKIGLRKGFERTVKSYGRR
jgi:nucleoside-diphosphate-sugar epimerase